MTASYTGNLLRFKMESSSQHLLHQLIVRLKHPVTYFTLYFFFKR